jgi:hypothetical protein
MQIISRDSPCYYLTSVTRDRLPVFRSDEIKLITARHLMKRGGRGSLLCMLM